MEQRSWLLIQNFKQQYEILFLVPQGIIFKLYSKKKIVQTDKKRRFGRFGEQMLDKLRSYL